MDHVEVFNDSDIYMYVHVRQFITLLICTNILIPWYIVLMLFTWYGIYGYSSYNIIHDLPEMLHL